MSDTDLLDNLLERWQDARAGGSNLSAEDLCGPRIDLIPALKQQMHWLQAMEGFLDAGGPGANARAPGDSFSRTETQPSNRPDGLLASGMLLPGYELLGELGRGGMGVVYKARQVGLNRLVALKMILSGGHASVEQRLRFQAEARVIARLQHPHIVQVFDIGEHQGMPFFSLELVEGGSLEKHLAGNPLPPPQAAALLATLAEAMQAAHDQGITHRDLKPANVLLARNDESGKTTTPESSVHRSSFIVHCSPKITDFGLAKHQEDLGQTQSGSVFGTPSYMAPEQAAGHSRQVGPAADIYALGAILYEMLTGRPPFRSATIYDTLQQVQSAEPIPPSRLQPTVPRDLETICLRCLRKEPRRRYASAQELADDVRRFLAGEPIRARPVSAWERAAKWARRRPAIASLSALLLVVTAVAFGLITWKWQESEANREAEATARHQAEVAEKAAEALARKENTARLDAEKAEAEAVRARDRARAEAQSRQQVAAFLVRLFEVSDPLGLQGHAFRAGSEEGQKLTARQILQRGADRITRDLKEQPAIQATLMDAIGNAMRSLGLFENAEPLLDRALAIRRKLLPADDPDLATSLFHLGWLCQDRGLFPKAEQFYRDALAIRSRRLGADDPETAACQFNLAWIFAMRGKFTQAEASFQQIVKQRERLLGKQHRDTAFARMALAGVYLEQGSTAQALPLIATALPIILEKEGKGSVGEAAVRFQQGVVAFMFGNTRGAEKSLRLSLATAQQHLGMEHAYIAAPLIQLGMVMERANDLEQAEKFYRQTLAIVRNSIGLEHYKSLMPIEHLAPLLARTGKVAEAEQLFSELVDVRRKKLGDDPVLAEAIERHAAFEAALGKSSLAESLYRDAIAVFRKTEVYRLGPYKNSLAGLAAILLARKQAAEVEPLLKEALALEQRPTNQGRDPRLPALLGEAYGQRGMDEAAEPYLNEAITLYRAISAQASGQLAPLRQLGKIQQRRGDYPAATKQFRDAYNLAKGIYVKAPHLLLKDADNLTDVLLQQKLLTQAEQVWREVSSYVNRNKGGTASLATCLANLALIRLTSGDDAGYQDACKQLMPFSGNQLRTVIWTWTLASNKSDEQQSLLVMARKAFGNSVNPTDNAMLGAMLHRAGNSREAIMYLENIGKESSPWQRCFLALAYRTTGQDEKAHGQLRLAAGASSLSWSERLARDLLCREAKMQPGAGER